jgi:nucleoside-diphosphate-sugar epimerase
MEQTAVVTGATGFVATELVKQLLAKGYNVRGTVRSTKDSAKTQALTNLAAALPGRLELFEADLLTDGTFDDAVSGAHYVFHTASPFFIKPDNDPHKELIEPAVHGTKNVLQSVARSKDTVKRVVLTSSVAAVHGDNNIQPPKNGSLYTADDWNTTSTPEEEPYFVSKTEAEKAAHEFAKAEGISLVAILPNFVMGPITSPTASGTSIGYMKGWLEGKPGGSPVHCDVRDVAAAHICAAERPAASGRYIVSHASSSNPAEVGRWLQEAFPEYNIPAGEDKAPEEKVDASRTEQDLGIVPTPLRETIVDMARTLIATGIAKPKQKQSTE